eukprot:SAG31_NODE_11680_length_1007_cov_1.202643_1_plen_335_part_11
MATLFVKGLAPDRPQVLRIDTTSSTATVHWKRPNLNGGALISFDLRVLDRIVEVAPSKTAHTIGNLPASTAISVSVRAINCFGDSEWSDVLVGVTTLSDEAARMLALADHSAKNTFEIFTLLSTCTPEQLISIKDLFLREREEDLLNYLQAHIDAPGMAQVFEALLADDLQQSNVSAHQVEQDVFFLHNSIAGSGYFAIADVAIHSTTSHLESICKRYSEIHGRTPRDHLQRLLPEAEMFVDAVNALLPPVEQHAVPFCDELDSLHSYLEAGSIGSVARTIAKRSNHERATFCNLFEQRFGRSIQSMVSSVCHGSVLMLLEAALDGNSPHDAQDA